MMKIPTLLFLVPVLLFATTLFTAEPPLVTGVAPTPRNFPRHTGADVEAMFKQSAEVGSVAVFTYQWSQPDFIDIAGKMMALCRQHKLSALLALSPTRLDARGKLDAPKALAAKLGGKLSFSEPEIAEEYTRAALELAKLKPAYLCLATEINFLALENSREFLVFAALCRQIYPKLKAASPETKVFVSFQWDIARAIDEKEPAKIAEHTRLIDVFRPALDVIAFTSYPFEIAASPEKLPADYYDGILKHVGKDDVIIFPEIGWPSGGKSSEVLQEAFIKRIPALFKKAKPGFIAWSLLHDVDIPEFSVNLGSTGLLTGKGSAKPGLAAFKALNR